MVSIERIQRRALLTVVRLREPGAPAPALLSRPSRPRFSVGVSDPSAGVELDARREALRSKLLMPRMERRPDAALERPASSEDTDALDASPTLAALPANDEGGYFLDVFGDASEDAKEVETLSIGAERGGSS